MNNGTLVSGLGVLEGCRKNGIFVDSGAFKGDHQFCVGLLIKLLVVTLHVYRAGLNVVFTNE